MLLCLLEGTATCEVVALVKPAPPIAFDDSFDHLFAVGASREGKLPMLLLFLDLLDDAICVLRGEGAGQGRVALGGLVVVRGRVIYY